MEGDGVVPLHGQLMGAAVFLDRVEHHLPGAVGAGLRLVILPAEGDGDGFARGGLPPHLVLDPLLENQVIAEHVVERDVGAGRDARHDGEGGEEEEGRQRTAHR